MHRSANLSWPVRLIAVCLPVAAAFAASGFVSSLAAPPAAASPLAVSLRHTDGTDGANARTSFTVQGDLTGVAATSAANAWAVGSTGPFGGAGTLIAHWNGTAWKRVPSPSPGSGDRLTGVAAVSARDAWAVGGCGCGFEQNTLILHWNGTAWKRVRSPSPAPDCELMAVAATSARNAWAVGFADPSGGGIAPKAISHGVPAVGVVIARTLILHWNGIAWKQVRSPNPLEGGHLMGVAAVSAGRAWAVGQDESKTIDFANLIVAWNGKSWKQVRVPNPPGGNNVLVGAAAGARDSAWAIGEIGSSAAQMERWTGTAWKQARIPHPGGYTLMGVAALSARAAWAVGGTNAGIVILRWNGAAWKRVTAAGPHGGFLLAVAASSPRNGWAVGDVTHSSGSRTLIVHWNGARWS